MSDIFKTLEYEAFRAGITPRTKQSMDWFRRKAHYINQIDRRGLMNEDPIELKNRPVINLPGNMYMFFYDPKHKDTLPYYDTFPLIVLIGKAPGGFYGLNLHYLPPLLRAKMLDSLMDFTTNKKYDETTRFKASYDLLQRAAKMKYYKPCFKHYLTKHVKGKFAYVPPPEWEIATFLPTANFKKANRTKVYNDSRAKI
jgi:hypothetical protein